MKSIAVIGIYFGKLPKYFNLWVQSCAYNKDVDFLVFTDDKPDNLPQNVKCIDFSFDKMKALTDEKLGFETALTTPYKCCDFRPSYGVIFQEYIKDYDFWGHCDFDVIFGNIRKFATEEVLDKYDKVFPMGHLSLYRNTPECNERYKCNGSKIGDYKRIYTRSVNDAFDEINGIYSIYKANNFPVYDERIFADISSIRKRFCLALKDKNYNHQAFYWENGAVKRAYYHNKSVMVDEFLYIHFKKRGFNTTLASDGKGFFISTGGFISKAADGAPALSEIDAVNPYNAAYELMEKIRNVFHNLNKAMRRYYHKVVTKRKRTYYAG